MAYNLQPLIQILDQILHPPDHPEPLLCLDPHERLHIESLLEKSRHLIEASEARLSVTGDDVQILEDRIRDAAHRAQNFIEFFLASRSSLPKLHPKTDSTHNLYGIKDESVVSSSKLDSAKKFPYPAVGRPEAQVLVGGTKDEDRTEIFVGRREDEEKLKQIDEEFKLLADEIKIKYKSVASSSSKRDSAKKFLNPAQIFVGRRKDVEKLKHSLMATEKSKKLEIIPIQGVDGIGKTTLARTVYNDPSVISHFNCRAWVTIAETYCVRDILLGLLACLPVPMHHERKLDYKWEEISSHINQRLRDRRYLIVIDNYHRNTEDWDDMIKSFPENVNGSRILVTTRQVSVAHYVSSGSLRCILSSLDEDESWDLLRRKVFGEGTYTPPELEKLGEEISRYCGGYPLAIHLVGGILLYLEKTKEAWEQVAERLKSCSDASHLFSVEKVLLLSYTHLPDYLKPCFLYMAAFPGGREISSSKLIMLWVAEGFLKPIPGRSIEEAAEEYLMELVQRSLLMVHKQEIRGKVKSYIMHDLVRDFCINKAREEKFLYNGIDATSMLNQKDVLRLRLSTVSNIPNDWSDHVASGAKDSAIISSLLLFDSGNHPATNNPGYAETDLSLLRVLHNLGTPLDMLPRHDGDLFHLRYLASSGYFSEIFSNRIKFLNLQTLILNNLEDLVIINDLLDLPQLRHITFKGKYPLLILSGGQTVKRQENLQTLSNVAVDFSFYRILEAIPNLRKLGILSRDSISRLIYLRNSSKLEILKCSMGIIPYNIPHSLKKLTIFKCQWLSSEFLHLIGGLPILEVLKLQCCRICAEWKPTEGEFENLRLLLLSWTNLKKWTCNEKHYPRLERLVIHDCCELEEIPGEIGYIPSLERIELLGECRHSAEESVKRMREKQLNLGNGILQVYINSCLMEMWSSSMEETWDEIISMKGNLSNAISIGKLPAISASEVKRMRDKKLKVGSSILPVNIVTSIWRKMRRIPSVVQWHKKFSLKGDLSNALSTAKHPAISSSEVVASPRSIQKDDLNNPAISASEIITSPRSIQTDDLQNPAIFSSEVIASPRSIQRDDLQNSSNPGVVVEISLAGELSMSVDLTLHAISSSSSNEMISFGLDPKRDDYSFCGVVKPKSGQASDGLVLGSRIMIGGDSESEEMLTLDKWSQAYVVTFTDKEHISLPEEPDCPNLIILFLQRSIGIIDFPEKFFDHMPGLRSVDLSGTRIRELPEPLYKKPQLQVLMLKNCNRLLKLRSEIEDVESLEVLDLSGTELLDLPHKIGQLIGLRHLKLSFYGPDDEREFAHLPPTLMSTGNLSKLEKLQVLSIEVHPEDYRWKDIAAEITKDVVKLEELTYLQYYFPTEKSLEDFTSKSPSWAQRRLRKFKFIVGENVNRIVSRVPEEVETAYHKHDGCLRYVNGDKAHEAVKTVLERASAFYVDHISDIESLTQFGISNFKSVRFCVVRECPRITVLIANDESNESAFKKLQYLFIYYLWGLQQIWEESVPLHNFQRLKHLTVHTCPKLSFIVSEAMVECFSNLEEIVVQHCDSLEAIIQENAVGVYGGEVLPKLRILVLHYLPKLVTLGDGISLSEDQIIHVESCPMLNLEPQLRKLNQSEEQSSCRTVP